jgi:hypothetical protein
MYFRRLFVGFVAVLALISARAVDVGGVFENLGTVVSLENGPKGDGTVTLHGLFTLEFDLALGRKLYADTARVEVTQLDSLFRVECLDSAGTRTWSGQWKYREGYARTEDQVNLILRSKRYENDGFLFFLRTVDDRKMLLVEVRRIISSWLGPVEKPVGVFLFNRLPGK